MVKLLRLKGDISVSNTEVRNTFKQPILIKPRSRIALSGLDVNIRDVGSNQQFVITDEAGEANNTLTVDGVSITLAAADYTEGDLLREMTRKIAVRAATQDFNTGVFGYKCRVATSEGFQLIKTNYNLGLAQFATDFLRADGNPTIDDNGNFTGAGGAQDNDILSLGLVPNATFYSDGTINGTDEIRIGAYWGEGTEWVAAVGINAAGNYVTIFDDTETASAIAGLATDVFNIEKVGTTVTLTVLDATGTQKLQTTHTMTDALWQRYWESDGGVQWRVVAPAGSAGSLTDVKLETTDSDTSDCVTSITFGSKELANYCGFLTLGAHTDTANPAIVASPMPMKGRRGYKGVMVNLDPLILESYDGAADSTYQPSIVYVIHDTRTLGTEVGFDVPNPIPLKLRNDHEMNLNQLRVTFRNSIGTEPLTFSEDPIITLLIYDPDE